MTNAEIITTAMVLAKLDPMQVIVNTFAGWKAKGYSVKRGEKAAFSTKIWKPCKNSKKQIQAAQEAGIEIDENERNMYLVNASFFTADQVEKLEKKEA